MWIYSLPQALFTAFGSCCLTLEDLVLMEMALPLFFFKAFPVFNKLPVMTIIAQLESCRLQGLRGGGCECSLLFEALNKERSASPEQILLPRGTQLGVLCCLLLRGLRGAEQGNEQGDGEITQHSHQHLRFQGLEQPVCGAHPCPWQGVEGDDL